MSTDKHLLRQAAEEIKILRQANESQHLRLKMFDDCMALFSAGGNDWQIRGVTNGAVDTVYQLEKRVAEIEQEEKMAPQEGKAIRELKGQHNA